MSRTIDTGTNDLLCRIEDRVGVLTFNRPERRNALSPAMYDAFDVALPALAADPEVRVVMLTGEGSAFCAGGDVKSMNESHQPGATSSRATTSQIDRLHDLRFRQRTVSLALHEYPKPVVAALPGAAAGAGMSIAMAADMRVGSPNALIVTAFSSIGASGDFGGSWFLTRLLGEAKAKELYFRSPRVDAVEAARLGLINEILDGDDFQAAALTWCAEIAERAPIALSAIKANVNRASLVDLGEALDAEAINMVTTMATADHREAVAAFVEKRTAIFKGE